MNTKHIIGAMCTCKSTISFLSSTLPKKIRLWFGTISLCMLTLAPGNAAADVATETITGDFLYTFSINSGSGIFKASYTYDPLTGTFSVDSASRINANPVGRSYGHIAINPQNPDLIINGGTHDLDPVKPRRYNINKNTGVVSSLLDTGAYDRVETIDIPNSTTVLGAGVTRPDVVFGEVWGGGVTRYTIGAGGVLTNPTVLNVLGDMVGTAHDHYPSVREVITTPSGTYYMSNSDSKGNFGCIGTEWSFGSLTYDTGDVTTATAVITHHMTCLPPYIWTGEYDPFSNTFIMSGNKGRIAQVALDGTVLSSFSYTSTSAVYGSTYEGIAVDGAGHAFITEQSDASLLYLDYSDTGIIRPQSIVGDVDMSYVGGGGQWYLSGIAFAQFPDTDGDGIPDNQDPCPLDPENDADGDGFCGDVDICPLGDDSINTDGDSLPDACDVCPLDTQNDADGDGICESDDNCPMDANPGQGDNDIDGLGDVCDPDDDNDTFLDNVDNCPLQANDQSDWDGDGAGDECDTDADGDGVLDLTDACPNTPVGEVVNTAGCSITALCPCEHPVGGDKWKNHGGYVSCVAHLAKIFREAGLITVPDEENIVAIAGMSSCGHKIK